jgi:hypothetical protein
MSSPTLWSVRLRRQARRLAFDQFEEADPAHAPSPSSGSVSSIVACEPRRIQLLDHPVPSRCVTPDLHKRP